MSDTQVEGPFRYTGHVAMHCRRCHRQIDSYWVCWHLWPPLRDVCEACAHAAGNEITSTTGYAHEKI